jgi:hypothetical protein
MHQVNPALVVALGAHADQIAERFKASVTTRYGIDLVPPIFQVLQGEQLSLEQIMAAYHTMLGSAARMESHRLFRESAGLESPPAAVIDGRRTCVFVVCPLSLTDYSRAVEVVRQIERRGIESVGITRNAIFLVSKEDSKGVLSDGDEAVGALDRDMRSVGFPFHRCFFVDTVNEDPVRLETDDVLTLVAEFVSLSVASDLSSLLRQNPPEYVGDGPHYRAYASFSWNHFPAIREEFAATLTDRLSDDIIRLCLEHGQQDEVLDGGAADWFGESIESFQKSQGPDGAANASKELFSDAAYKDAESRLNELSRSTLKSLKCNLATYRNFVDRCLESGLVQLELLREKMMELEGEVSDYLIKQMLRPTKVTTTSTPARIKRAWGLFFLLLGSGLALTAYALVTGRQQIDKQKPEVLVIAGVGILLIVASVVVVMRKKVIPAEERRHTETLTYDRPLAESRKAYENEERNLHIHLKLFAQLDKACLSLDVLMADLSAPKRARALDKFRLDFLDRAAIKKFYEEEFNADKQAELFATLNSQDSEGLHRALFSYPDARLIDFFRSFCRRHLSFVNEYSLEQIVEIVGSSGGLQSVPYAPFWNPLVRDGEERTILVSTDAGSRELLGNFFSSIPGMPSVVYTDKSGNGQGTIVQVAYGVGVGALFERASSDGARAKGG